MMRGKIQRLSNTHIVFAGSERRILSEMFHSDKKPFYQSATTLLLEPIENDIYYAFAQKQFSQSGKQLQKEAFDYVYDLFGGVTLYVHRVLHDCYYYTEEGETCTKKETLEYPNSRKSCCMLSAQKSMQQESLQHHSSSVTI